MNLARIISFAKALLPSNSPWLERIDQAAQMAKSFSPNKDGIAQLMDKYGKNRDDLKKAVGMLDNPVFKKMLGNIPGLGKMLNGAANELLQDNNLCKANIDNSRAMHDSGSSIEALQARLNRLK